VQSQALAGGRRQAEPDTDFADVLTGPAHAPIAETGDVAA